jgi:hypothetical protein
VAFAGETVYVYSGESTNANPIHLVQICKQIRHETFSLFYTRCTFNMFVKRYLKRPLDFDRESREHAMATRGLVYLDDISQVVGLENSALITSLQISCEDAEEQANAVHGDRLTQRFQAVLVQSRLAMMARGMRVSYAEPERVEVPVPEVHSLPALERVHVSGSKSFASGRVAETEIEKALRSGFSKQDLVVTFETETEEALRLGWFTQNLEVALEAEDVD